MSDNTIFDLHEEHLRIIAELEEYCLENDTDEIPEHIFERLYVNDNEIKEKLQGYQRYIQALDAKVAMLDEEIVRLTKIRKSKEQVIQRLKGLMGFAIQEFGAVSKTGSKFVETNFYKFTFVKSPKAQINNLDEIPVEFLRPEITVKIDDYPRAEELVNQLAEQGIDIRIERKPALKLIVEKLKANEDVPGATLDRDNGYIRVT